MREFPVIDKSFPRADVVKVYPNGAIVRLTRAFVHESSGIFNPNRPIIETLEWKVIDHYYEVGSRRNMLCGTVVGIPYSEYKKLCEPRMPLGFKTYGQLPDRLTGNGWLRAQLCAPELRDHRDMGQLVVLILTDWNGVDYNEILGHKSPAVTAEDVIGDLF